MPAPHTVEANQGYSIFLSYRHVDNKQPGRQWATWLHQMLESYEVPLDLVGTRNLRGEPVPSSLYPVFRDEEELPADADLTRNIRQALERTRLLVVLCSPRAVASRFVAEEITYFKELGRAGAVLALMLDGEPNASDDPGKQAAGLAPAMECLPKPMRFGVTLADGGTDWEARTEPIAADARPGGRPEEGWTSGAAYRVHLQSVSGLDRASIEREVADYEQRLENAKLKIIAGALGVPLRELTQRDKKWQLERARQRARTLRRWLAAVAALAAAAVVAGVLAYRNLKEAERQMQLVEQERSETARQRDVALHQLYRNAVRLAAEGVAAGEYPRAKKVLLECAPPQRQWEWWYLMARCGPATVRLDNLVEMGDPKLAEDAMAIKKRLDNLAAKDSGPFRMARPDDPNPQADRLVLDYQGYRGRGGTTWQAWRGLKPPAILVGGFYTGMYGGLPAALVDLQNNVCWRLKVGERRSRPATAAGEVIHDDGDYLTVLRERHVVGEPGTPAKAADLNVENGHEVNSATWADDLSAGEKPLRLAFEPGGAAQVVITAEGMKGTQILDLGTSTLAPFAPQEAVPGLREPMVVKSRAAPSKEALQQVSTELQRLARGARDGFRVLVEKGAHGPVILTSWNGQNLRLRDGTTGKILGEAVNPLSKENDGMTMGGRVTVLPGTNLVAGWFSWQGKTVAAVVDLEQPKLVCQLERADAELEFPYPVTASLDASPSGEEVAFELFGRNEHLFTVWNTHSGKLVYGHLGDLDGSEAAGATPRPDDHLPKAFAWDPENRFVAICRLEGATDLRASFAAAPLATIDGVEPGPLFRVQPLGEPGRVLIGNVVVDTARWENVIVIPPVNLVAGDGRVAVVQTRPGVVDVIRLPAGTTGTTTKLRDRLLLREIHEHDSAGR